MLSTSPGSPGVRHFLAVLSDAAESHVMYMHELRSHQVDYMAYSMSDAWFPCRQGALAVVLCVCNEDGCVGPSL